MRYGISTDKDSETTLLVNRCRFEDLLHTGIYQANGSLTAVQTNFNNCYANGILQDFTIGLNVNLCRFVYDTDTPGGFLERHNGINVARLGVGSQVSISHSYFEINQATDEGIGVGIYFQPGANGVSTQTKISIRRNEFNIRTGRGIGINMEGNFLNLSPGTSSISQNNFTLFRQNGFSGINGIFLTGDFQHFSIQANHFYGIQAATLGALTGTISIYWYGQGNSTDNIIGNNVWHLPENPTTLEEVFDLDLHLGILFYEQEFAKICNNQFFNIVNVAEMGNLGNFSVFSNNILGWMAKGPSITSGEIGPQEHKGNQWVFPAVELNNQFLFMDILPSFGYHIKCTPNPANSRFFVHTPQATMLFDVGHPYHPFDIEPDIDNEFFVQTPGTPQECPLPGFSSNIPDLDKHLADGYSAEQLGFSAPELWQHQRRLYRLLQTNATYNASYSGFPGFVAQHQNGSVGKFYQVHTLLSQATAASMALSSQALALQQVLSENSTEIAYLDSLLQEETSPATIAALKAAQAVAAQEILSAQSELGELQAQYEAPRATYYQQAQIVNNSVNAVAVYEVNEKTFNHVMLNALLTQSGKLTEQDAQILRGIAAQCPKTGGIAVIKSRSLLDDCYEDEVNDYTADCMGELPEEYQVSTMVVDSPNNERSAKTIAVVGGDIILNALFVEGSRYLLQDLNGRTVGAGNLDASMRVLVRADLAPGVYICTVSYPSGKTIAQKVVITQ
jgi:hypothetical protein